MTEKESKTQTKVMNVIKKYDGYVYKNAQNMYTEKGRPDLTACIPVSIKHLINLFGEDATIGLFLGIEMKRPGKINNTSDAQEIVGRQIQKAGGMWYVVDDPMFVDRLMQTLTGGDK